MYKEIFKKLLFGSNSSNVQSQNNNQKEPLKPSLDENVQHIKNAFSNSMDIIVREFRIDHSGVSEYILFHNLCVKKWDGIRLSI